MEKINANVLVAREMRNKHLSAAEIARRLNLNPTSIKTMLYSDTMQVQRLLDMSNLLQYNFFREIANNIPYTDPVPAIETVPEDQTLALNERIKELEIEVRILRETLNQLIRK